MGKYKFAAASDDESIVFGAARPGYSPAQVNQWIAFMQAHGIQRICCLLPPSQLSRYSELLEVYRQTFGGESVCWAPLDDFHVFSPETLIHQVLPFLALANRQNEKVVVHCSGGIGRTGQALAAWLVAGRGFSIPSAIAAVKRTGRNPYEAVIAAPFRGQNPWAVAAQLDALMAACQVLR